MGPSWVSREPSMPDSESTALALYGTFPAGVSNMPENARSFPEAVPEKLVVNTMKAASPVTTPPSMEREMVP